MNNQPLISVIIPVYNVEQYLSQCLGSVTNQTYPNLEIICVNDASTDGSLEILNQFAENDQRVRVIGKQNEGVSRARNVGLQLANGEYVMFVDADDWIETDTCEKAIAAMHYNKADIVMWSYVSEYGATNSPKTIFLDDCVFERKEILNRLHRRFIGIVGEELEHPELADAICPVWGKLYKRSLIVQSGAAFIDLAEIGTYEDGMFNLETFFYANKVVYLNQCLYHYRRSNTTSVTSGYREELFGLWQNLYQRMGQYIQEKNLPAIYNEALQNRIALGVLGLTLNVSSAQKSFFEKRRELREILKSEKYHTALTSLDISGMPKKWKLFYGCAQYGNASALLFAGGGILHSYNSPLVSIVLPVYNVEQYLPMCLDSILNQTYQNIELVCVDDGSPDNCGQILEKYAAMDERILVIAQKNQGLSGARNTGMRYAHGEYIMFVDSDDWIEAETCEVAVSAALKYGADLVMWSYVREYDQDSKEKYMFWEDETVFEKAQVRSQLHRRLCGLLGEELRHPDYANALETAWGKLYLAERIINNHVEFIDTKEIGTEDALFNLYALGYIERAVYLHRCYNHYRKNNQGSLTKTYNKKLFERWQRLFDYMRQYIQENNLPVEYDTALDNRIALSLLGLGLNIVGSNYSMWKKITLLQDILTNDRYEAAYKELDFSFFPIHWKVFYGFAAHGFTFGVYILLSVIRKIIYG